MSCCTYVDEILHKLPLEAYGILRSRVFELQVFLVCMILPLPVGKA